jgi:hypothetical protein
MLRHSETAVIARNEKCSGRFETEPFEAGWAEQAIAFVTTLDSTAKSVAVAGMATIQVSPDGLRWTDEGTAFAIGLEPNKVSMARVAHFGNWLRLVIELPPTIEATLIVTLHLK